MLSSTQRDINFVLRRHPDEKVAKNLEREYLRTSKMLKVYHMKKFLSKKLAYGKFHDFQIICFQNQNASISQEEEEADEPRLLPEDLTLLDIETQVGSADAELVLYYTLRQAKGGMGGGGGGAGYYESGGGGGGGARYK
jgi:hypothetical protein